MITVSWMMEGNRKMTTGVAVSRLKNLMDCD